MFVPFESLEDERFEPKVMEVDGSDGFIDKLLFNWVIFSFQLSNFSGFFGLPIRKGEVYFHFTLYHGEITNFSPPFEEIMCCICFKKTP